MIETLMLATNSLATNGLLLAADEVGGFGLLLKQLMAAVVFSALGIVVLAICFWIMGKLTPFSLIKEIEEDQNTSLGIVLGSVAIGISIIIAAAIRG
jgi:putative membrane protein